MGENETPKPRPIDRETWDAMCPEEQDALIASGWHPAIPGYEWPKPPGWQPSWEVKRYRHG